MAGQRAICSATISFGLVSIPVKGYNTASAEKFSFKRISPKGNATSQKVFDAVTNEEIKIPDCQSGYEVEKGKFVIFTDEEMDTLAMEKSNTIEMLEVSDAVNLSPAVVEKAMYLAPEKSDKSYKLLARCLREEKKVAIAKWYSRGKDNLVAIAPVGDILMMFQLYYEPELRSPQILFAKGSDPTDQEVKLGKMLMAQLSTGKGFELGNYRDEYMVKVECAIAAKLAGKSIAAVKTEATAAAFDLAALLESSLKKG